MLFILVCRHQADLCFVVDSSGSLNDADPNNWNRVKDFIKEVIGSLEIGEDEVRVSVVKFSNRGNVQFYLNDFYDLRSLDEAIDSMRYAGGHTNTSGGIYRMHKDVFTPERGDRAGIPNTAVIITDGVSTIDNKKTIPYAAAAKDDGIRIIAIGVTDKINMNELKGIATAPTEPGETTIFTVDDFVNLSNVVDNLIKYTCVTPPPLMLPPPLRKFRVRQEYIND